MSGSTPTKKLQLKTDFFRGSSSGPSSTGSSAPSSSITEGLSSSSTSPSKKRSSRIPFIGRSRKKSIHSDADVDTSVSSDTKESRASVATTGSNYRSTLARHGGPVISLPHASTSQQSLKTSAVSTSLGSKIAAHFTPSKGGLRLQRHKSQRAAKKSHEELSEYTSDSQAPPPSLELRSPSIVSNISHVSRSSTPRASQAQEEFRPQPTITVSRPPVDDDLDSLEEYNDLFTKPRHKLNSVPMETEQLGTYQPRTSLHNDTSPPSSPTPHTISTIKTHVARAFPSSATTRTTDDVTVDFIHRTGSKVQKLSRSSAGDPDRASISGASVSSFHAMSARRKVNSVLQQGIDIDTADESEAMSIRSAMSMPTSFRSATALDKHRSLVSSNSVRTPKSRISRMKLPSKPPSIPLPATPPSSELSSSLSNSQVLRQRAHTIASSHTSSNFEHFSGSASLKAPSPSKQNSIAFTVLGKTSSLSRESTIQIHTTDRNSSSSSSSSTPTLTKSFPKLEKLHIDIDTASTEELREALRYRNQQFEELSDRLLQIAETHAIEKRAWEEKIAELERDALRREKEIKGLARLVKHAPGDRTNPSGSRTPSLVEMERERSDDSSVRSSIPTPSSSVRLPLNRLLQSEDSESYPTSTSEWGSGTSGAEDETQMATIKPRRTMRKLKLVESVNRSLPASRSMSLKQPGSGLVQDISGYASDPRKRSSASSSSSISPDHSPTSLVFPASQLLNPIPESHLVSGSKENHVTFSLEEPKRERKSSKSSHYYKSTGQPSAAATLSSSIPSVTPGSRLTPSEAYIMNLRKSRSSSIAQILDQNEKADQPTTSSIEESYGGRSRALLAGINPAQN
ncbi:hypothetical protein GGU10DRAFT_340957 [Lentinula aff. detonsa]|uniref:Uncharacterized protein n=1 Tax=Lentinula aff. detonsa TaxID=2804958 RepID=A0AA38NSH9_9AGAR|nr:hypothetical protein GGU10DRAFT_340957 [Lentinula aff. detonsa]